MKRLLKQCGAVLSVSTLICVAAPEVCAAEHWIVLQTPHFEMYTTNGEKQATEALKVFEQIRYFFLQASHSKTTSETPICIIAFRSEKEFKPYRLNDGFAYYLPSRKRDYVVMQDISPEHYQAVFHEYTHLVVEHLGLKFPIWLNEGIADLYSSLEPQGNRAIVGKPLPDRVSVLLNQRWLPLPLLFSVTHDSPYYNEQNKMSIFYAESWALTHMIELNARYPPENLPKFLAEISAGRSSAECFASVYGKTPGQVEADLHAYIKQSTVRGAIFDVKLSKQLLEPEILTPNDFDVDLALTDLLASQQRTAGEAEQRLNVLAREHPGNADVEESLGYLAWQKGEVPAARDHFGKAEEAGSKDPDMLIQYAGLLYQANAPKEQIMAALEKAIAIRPDSFDAQFNWSMVAMQEKKWGAALSKLSHIKTVTPDRAFSLFYNKAVCDFNLRALDEARANTNQAQQYAKTPDEKDRAAQLLTALDRMQNPSIPARSMVAETTEPAANDSVAETPIAKQAKPELRRDQPSVHWPGDLRHVEGIAKYVECNGKSLRIRVAVNSKLMTFDIDDPESVIVRNAKNGSFSASCGVQKPFPLGVFYIAIPGAGSVDGNVKELVF